MEMAPILLVSLYGTRTWSLVGELELELKPKPTTCADDCSFVKLEASPFLAG